MRERTNTQQANIRRHLEGGLSITPIEALTLYGCFRLAAQIFELKKKGLRIETEIIYIKGKHFAQYSLKRDE